MDNLYEKEVVVKSVSVISGETKYREDISNSDIPILKTFWEDNDIQEITVVSTNVGFVKTFTKVYVKEEKPKS
jgi:hypothetical protein